MASVKQEVNAVWTVLLGCRGLMGHGSLGSRFFLLPQPTGHRGRSREVGGAKSPGRQGSQLAHRHASSEGEMTNPGAVGWRQKMTSEVTCSAGETSFECVSDYTRSILGMLADF